MAQNPFKNNQGKKKILLLVVLLMGFLPLISSAPSIDIVYPYNNTYWTYTNLNINYTVSDIDLDSCWYSNDTMSENISLGSGGICLNITTAIWNEGGHDVIIWANDTSGNINYSSIKFIIQKMDLIINITYPLNVSYNDVSHIDYVLWGYDIINIKIFGIIYTYFFPLNYTFLEGNNCWYSLDNGDTNSSSINCDGVFNDLISIEGSNTWRVYANFSIPAISHHLENEDTSSITFFKETLPPITGNTVYEIMNSAGAGLGSFMINFSQGAFVFLVIIGLIAVFVIIGFAVAKTMIESLKNSQK